MLAVLALVALPASGAEALVAEPLAARSAPRGATLFATMPAAQTGIVAENRYADPLMWTDHYQELVYGAMGTGVAVGDFDGDGRVDLFVVSKTEASRLFRNLGGWKFEEVTVQAGISEPGKPAGWTQGAAFADVDNDGRLDLYLCRFGVPNQLFMNRGDGTFREEAAARGLAVVDASGMAAFGDYDRDGDLDVFVQTNLFDAVKAPGGQKDFLFRNRGDGTFDDVTVTAGIAGEAMGHSAVWWDYDGDGWPDLYVANDYASPDVLYHNNRDGTFANVINRVVPRTPYYSMGSDLGDVDNDGRLDLLVADMAASTREKDQRGMAGSRARTQDQTDDPVIAPPLMHSALYLNTGGARFREGALQAGMAATDWTWSPRWEDFDLDGRVDLHLTNGMIREYHNADLLERLMALENPADSRRAMQAAPVFAERNLAYRNQGGLAFEEVGVAWGLGQVGVSFGSATGDFDGDGDLDLVYGNYEAGPTVLRNDSDTGHRLVVALQGTTSNRFGVGATVRVESTLGRQVRTLVLARGYLSTSEPVLHFGLGKDEIIKTLTVEWPSGHRQRFTNLSADQKLTITEPAGPARPEAALQPSALFTAQTLDLVTREQPETDSNPQALLPFRFDRRGPALAVLPKDGREQLLLGGTTKDPLTGFALADALDDGPLLVFEANGDGLPDLLQTKAGTSRPIGADYQPKLHLGTATGFTSAPLPALPQSTGAVTAADFDRDGDLDVFLGARVLPGKYPLSPRSVLLRNDGGRFTEMPLPQNGELGLITSAVWSDLDADGWPDLLLATEWGPVVYLHNEQGQGFTDRSVAQGFAATGFWSSIVAGDFNGDGRSDYAVGNAGLNTAYRDGPAILFHGRFGDGGPPQVIEAMEENTQLYPRRTRNELGPRVAGLLRRFPRQNDYAKATLTEVLGAERLAKARRFDATELRSGVYLSQPVGPHRFVALPWEVQLAPVQGMVALDVTGDGHVDLALVQNSHAPASSLGRFSGGVGVMLAGDGRGGFRALDPQTSGLLVPGDAKALVVTDRNADGWPDLVASRNDESALAFVHRGLDGHRPLRVALQGPAGNPSAIGANVTLILADGSTRTAMVSAGSGYYSQSTPAVFFSFPAATPPRSITITWPDGATSAHPLSADATGTVVLNHATR
ncbi:FG-GAP repeat protein [Lacunisphaera limnophila]|uniref:FG-GAP repeat protein n=2 Tax=Lacunisphaera limnophila TaxID=1838286 RepID=A0A1D8ARS5_9BACT|nr:FG-GAP-like repeat-containing protein [Lacunisphaera limnophila]AOS43593.1 FG-GAP repeat protein [Lacunisphaera limnophila]